MSRRDAADRALAPPHSRAAEESLIGGVLLDSSAYARVTHVRAEDFHEPELRVIWGAVCELMQQDAPADSVTVSEHLQRKGQLGDVGGLAEVAKLVKETASSANVSAYADIVIEKARLRRLQSAGVDIAGRSYDELAAQVRPLLEAAKPLAHGPGYDVAPLFWPGDADAYEPPSQLVAGLLPRIGLAAIYGPPNSGKTALASDLAAAIARGTPWRGRAIADGGGLVLYVAAENPGSAKLRMKAYVAANPDAVEMPLAILPGPLQLGVIASVESLIERIREAEMRAGRTCVAVFVDTLAAAMAGLEENSVKDMGLALHSLSAIRDAISGLVGVVHHSGKDSEKGARGSSALRAAVDTEIVVSGVDGTRTATVVKQRDFATGATFDFTLDPIVVGRDPATGDNVTAIAVKHGAESTASAKRRPTGKAQVAILNAMEAGEVGRIWTPDDFKVICAAAGVTHRNTRRDALVGLGTTGFIIQTVGGYRLP
jgi:hypothetical protein